MIHKYFKFKLIFLIAIVFIPAVASAVTPKEMEQARTIAAKSYLRYANDGSGYLDDINPVTMAELEASLKKKEQENIKAFKEIPVPTDYKDWGKEKLVEYWAVTAFQNKGLLEKGRGGRIRARSQINKMTIAPPQAEQKPVAEVANTEVNSPNEAVKPVTSVENPAVELKELKEEENALMQEEETDDFNVGEAHNYTWVYIMVLAILVAIVIALVVYAANVMKKNGSANEESQRDNNDAVKEAEEHYESMLADKDVEIAMLRKKLETATRQNSELKSKIESLNSQIISLQSSASLFASQDIKKDMEKERVAPSRTGLRTIYLGRANSRGIFVRADRSINPGHSIFVLETSDGVSGTFRVVDSPSVWMLALSNPSEYLETACIGYELQDTENVTRIITESAGTAVFEGGCWRVVRKTRIRYE